LAGGTGFDSNVQFLFASAFKHGSRIRNSENTNIATAVVRDQTKGGSDMTGAKVGLAIVIVVAGLAVPTVPVGHAQTAGRKYVYSKDPISKTLPFSEAVRVGDTLYVAGHIGTDPKTGQAPASTEEEIKLLFDVFRADMAEANFKMDDLVSVRVYCTDLALYAQFNTSYRTQFGKDLPARAFIGVASLLRAGHFEMEGIAVKNRS
jgi:2-iminobutanoate/2-iminopropanoate deaminase